MKKLIRGSLLAPMLALALAGPLVAQTTINVHDADIRAFIADAARVTGRIFIIDARVNGKVTVVSERPLSKSEYFEIFLSTLRANGLVAVPTSNGAFRIQPLDNASSQPSRVGAGSAGRNAFVTEVVRLRSIDAASAVDTVRTLVSPQGSVTANRGGNSIVIVDFADNVRRVRQVLARIDTDNASTRVVALKNAGAREIATALQTLIGTSGQGGGAGTGPSASVVAIVSSNSIALRGDPATVSRLAGVAEDLDRRAKNGTEIKVIFLENADAEQLLPVLQQLVGQPATQPTQTQLSQTSMSVASRNGGGTSGNIVPPQNQATQSQAGGATGGQAAVSAEGGRTASVVTRFAGANAIVIAAPAEVQRQLGEVVHQLDTRREQVLVEAIVAEVSDTTADKLGVQFLLAGLPGSGIPSFATTYSNSAPNLLTIAGAIGARSLNTTTTTVNGNTTTTTTGSTTSDTLAQSAISSILGANGGFGGGAFNIGKDAIFGTIINAVKSDTTSNLLQSPHVITLDNQPARILVGQEIPITTGQALSTNFDNAFRTVQRENVGIELEVRPQINASGAIKLFLHQQVSSIAGPVSSDNSDLILNKREVETTLTVDDGQIAVIGGLLDDNERRTVEKIPLLGDLPGIGALFRSKAKTRTKTNLMIFIRPTILRTAEDTRRVTEQRYGYLRVQQAGQRPDEEPSIDQLVRDYLGAAAPLPPAGMPGSIEDPRIAVPTQPAAGAAIRRKRRH
ncbi:type II secretion system secretin GspD [Sphingomonas sp. AR_OL41]|uniref:type II secretion system secretin GspD n=1 Tax=Sphingomonas sp. AR_OL41 TaxID=3042729 RepID=UPI002480B650|nr:type II secretion system secretin GspD [Sphingomonas sp. AR_OL41]MDH7972283.1 type II secretion system secretin GspD [Sphingomonas sp. AR_OL41]